MHREETFNICTLRLDNESSQYFDTISVQGIRPRRRRHADQLMGEVDEGIDIL